MPLATLDRHRWIDASQHLHRISRMSIGENDRIRTRQPAQVVAAFHNSLRLLTIVRAVLGDRLIEAHQWTSAAMAEENNLGDPGLTAGEVHGSLHIERRFFPTHL